MQQDILRLQQDNESLERALSSLRACERLQVSHAEYKEQLDLEARQLEEKVNSRRKELDRLNKEFAQRESETVRELLKLRTKLRVLRQQWEQERDTDYESSSGSESESQPKTG